MHPFMQQPSKGAGWSGMCEHGHWTSKARHSNAQCQTRGFVNLTGCEVAPQDNLTGLLVRAGRRKRTLRNALSRRKYVTCEILIPSRLIIGRASESALVEATVAPIYTKLSDLPSG